jgi:hypothetical protein
MTARRVAPAAAALCTALLLALPAAAHDGALSGIKRGTVGLSRSTWRLKGDDLDGELVFVRHQLVHAVTGAPSTAVDVRDEVDDAVLEAGVTARVDVSRGDEACRGEMEAPSVPVQPGGFVVHVLWHCPGGPEPIRAKLRFLSSFEAAHRHLAAVDDGAGSRTEVLGAADPVLELAPGRASVLPLSFLTLGIEHILGGYDHLVFLFGLILLGGRARSLLGTVTAFTLAHSITLALAALGVWNPGPAIVEPAIGATICYVGIENLFLKEPKGRWRITFLLGLVHGFGFAGALAEAGLAKQHLVAALLLFNGGVEIGQVMVLAAVLPLVLLARRQPWVVSRAVPVASVAVAVVGLALFVIRVAG